MAEIFNSVTHAVESATGQVENGVSEVYGGVSLAVGIPSLRLIHFDRYWWARRKLWAARLMSGVI